MIGKYSNGIALCRFQYILDDQEYVGVLAQELLQTSPDAVLVDKLGYLRVDYAAIGLKIITYKEWITLLLTKSQNSRKYYI